MRFRGGSPESSARHGRPQSRVVMLTRQSSTPGSPHAVVRRAGPRPHSLAHKCTKHPVGRSAGLIN